MLPAHLLHQLLLLMLGFLANVVVLLFLLQCSTVTASLSTPTFPPTHLITSCKRQMPWCLLHAAVMEVRGLLVKARLHLLLVLLLLQLSLLLLLLLLLLLCLLLLSELLAAKHSSTAVLAAAALAFAGAASCLVPRSDLLCDWQAAVVAVLCRCVAGWLATPVPTLQFEDGGFAVSIGTMAGGAPLRKLQALLSIAQREVLKHSRCCNMLLLLLKLQNGQCWCCVRVFLLSSASWLCMLLLY
jgi:hypothetical protein